MKLLNKLFLSLIIFASFVHSEITPIEIEEVPYYIIPIEESTTHFILNNIHNSARMIVDLMLSHPSKYALTFNEYKENKTADYTQNTTGLVNNEKYSLGKNSFILNLQLDEDKIIEKVIITLKRKENAEPNSKITEKIMIRYVHDEEENLYFLKNNNITLNLVKDILDIDFGGISAVEKYSDFTNTSAVYTIELYDLKSLEDIYENIYFIFYENNGEVKAPLYKTTLNLKGKILKFDNCIKIRAPLNKKKEQIVFVKGKVKDFEDYLTYSTEKFFVQEGEEIIDDDKKEDNNNDNNDKNKKGEEGNKDEKKKNNDGILVIIMLLFLGSIALTFVGVFIFITKCKTQQLNISIEQDEDYKNIGKIKEVTDDDA